MKSKIAELLRLNKLRTPGPWRAKLKKTAFGDMGLVCASAIIRYPPVVEMSVPDFDAPANCEYIAAAANLAPALAERVAELEASIKVLGSISREAIGMAGPTIESAALLDRASEVEFNAIYPVGTFARDK